MFPTRLGLNQIVEAFCGNDDSNGREMSFRRHVILTGVLTVILLSMACGLKLLDGLNAACLVLDVISAFFAVHISFTFPGMMFLKLNRLEKRSLFVYMVSLP